MGKVLTVQVCGPEFGSPEPMGGPGEHGGPSVIPALGRQTQEMLRTRCLAGLAGMGEL